MDNTGPIGEKLFDLWCSQAKITCNKSNEDKVGWDFRLDFSEDKTINLTDLHKPSPHCLVQVKTTRSKSTHVKVKLSNLKRYITTLEPIFLLLIQIDKQDQPVKVFLVHVGKKIIDRGLARIAKHSQNGFGELHKSKFQVSCKQSDEITPINGHTLKSRLLSNIAPDIHAYMAEKRKLLEKSGYSNHIGRINFSIRDFKTLSALIEMSIGLRDSVKIDNVSSSVERFGIEDVAVPEHPSSGVLFMPDRQPDASGSLRVSLGQFGSFIELDAQIYISPFHIAADEDLQIARVTAGPLTLLFNRSFTKANFQIELDYESSQPFLHIAKYGRLFSILTQSEKSPFLELQFENGDKWSSPISITSNLLEEFSWLNEESRNIKMVEEIFDYFEVDKTTPIKMDSLFESGLDISSYHAILTGSRRAFKVVFDVTPDVEISQDEARYISTLAFRIGSLGFGLVYSLTGNLKRESKDALVMYSSTMTVEEKLVTKLPDAKFLSTLSALVDEIASEAAEDEYIITDSSS